MTQSYNVLQMINNYHIYYCIHRDVFLEGTCDDGVRKLANLLGWEVSIQ